MTVTVIWKTFNALRPTQTNTLATMAPEVGICHQRVAGSSPSSVYLGCVVFVQEASLTVSTGVGQMIR